MPMLSAPYHFMSCNGKIANLLTPNCPATSAGGFDEDLVRADALASGWTVDGKSTLCPGCSRGIDVAAPKRTPKAKVAAVNGAVGESFPA